MGEVIGGLCNHIVSALCILNTLLFHDVDGQLLAQFL